MPALVPSRIMVTPEIGGNMRLLRRSSISALILGIPLTAALCAMAPTPSGTALAATTQESPPQSAGQRAQPMVPVQVQHATAISPSECTGKDWVFATFKTDVPGRQFKAVVRTKIDRSWIFGIEKKSTDKKLEIWINGSCKTVERMLAAGASSTRISVLVTAPDYREAKITVEIPVRY